MDIERQYHSGLRNWRREFFDSSAPTWDERHEDPGTVEAFRRWASSEAVQLGGRILEVGCGTGRTLWSLKGHLRRAATVFGVDDSMKMLRIAKARAANLALAEARRLPFADRTFDLVCAVDTWPHLQPALKVIPELHRVLRPGGELHILHLSSRQATNAYCAQIPLFRVDELPAPLELATLLARSGFEILEATETADSYFVRVRAYAIAALA